MHSAVFIASNAALLASISAMLALNSDADLSFWQFLGAILVGVALGFLIIWWIDRR